MRLALLASCAAFLLAAVSGQKLLVRPTQADTPVPAITACAQTGADWAAAQGARCSQLSMDSTPGSVLSHTIFTAGCGRADLHVLRYAPTGGAGSNALVATWCA